MGAAPRTLPALEIAIRCRSAALTGLKPISIHCKTHRAAWLTPLKAGLPKYLIKAFPLCLGLDQPDPGTTSASFTLPAFLRPLMTAAAARKSSMRESCTNR